MRHVALPSPAPQRPETGGRQRPTGLGPGDATARRQHGVRLDEFVGGRPHVHAGVVKHQVFNVDELAFEQERGAGVGEMGPGDPAIADWAPS